MNDPSRHALQGVLPVVHTPFLDDDSIDEQSLRRQIDWAYEQGADGLCTGMVSELLRLTADERIWLTRTIAAINAGRGPFVASVGAESTRQAIVFATAAVEAGATALMAIPPALTRLPAAAVERYYAELAEAVSAPLIVQDASSYVGQQIPLEVCVRLLDRFGPEKILFKPEAAPLGPNLSLLRDGTGGRARILEGSGGIALVDSHRRGIVGTIPGLEFLPLVVALWRALQAGDESATYRLHAPLCALVALQLQAGLDGFLAVEKYVLWRRGLFATQRRRQPYAWSMDEETRLELDRLLAVAESALG